MVVALAELVGGTEVHELGGTGKGAVLMAWVVVPFGVVSCAEVASSDPIASYRTGCRSADGVTAISGPGGSLPSMSTSPPAHSARSWAALTYAARKREPCRSTF
ncbi:MAG TPA: hypothetical protein VMF65_21705 [Acidimicrobiales bacterium]|nr:hypothetical protein [Acidimicrobiales bacterium]